MKLICHNGWYKATRKYENWNNETLWPSIYRQAEKKEAAILPGLQPLDCKFFYPVSAGNNIGLWRARFRSFLTSCRQSRTSSHGPKVSSSPRRSYLASITVLNASRFWLSSHPLGHMSVPSFFLNKIFLHCLHRSMPSPVISILKLGIQDMSRTATERRVVHIRSKYSLFWKPIQQEAGHNNM